MANSSRREALTMGLAVGGLSGLVGRAWGRQTPKTKPEQDPTERPAPKVQGEPPRIGTVRLNAIFKSYRKAVRWTEQMQAEREARDRELGQILEQLRVENERFRMLQLQPRGSPDAAKSLVQIRQLERAHEAARTQAHTELAQHQTEGYGRLYLEVQQATSAVAKERALTVVLDLKTEPLLQDDGSGFPSYAVIYADPATDITGEVIARLNQAN
jgi:Skp family chaperone for outer membrane proteins